MAVTKPPAKKKRKFPRTLKPPIKDPRPDQRIDPNVSDSQCDLIGRVIVSWSKLEAAMQNAVWHLLKLSEDDGRTVTARMDAGSLGDMLRVLGGRHIPDGGVADKFFEALARINELREDRNFIAHGVWGTIKPENEPLAMSLRPKSDPNRVVGETFPKARMQGILHDITVAGRVITGLPDALPRRRGKRPRRHQP